MKRFTILFILSLLIVSEITAQATKTDYFINTSTTRSSLNPALRPSQGYVGFPGLSNVYVDIKTNTFNLDHLLFKKEGDMLTFMHPEVSSDEFLKNMSDNNYVSADLAWSFLSAGWYAGEGFWTVNFGARAYTNFNIPKSVFELMKEGFSDEEEESHNYDLKNIGGNATAFFETALGYSRPLLDNSLMVGVKVKHLLGVGDMNLNIDRMNIAYDGPGRTWSSVAQASLNGSYKGIKPKYKYQRKLNREGVEEEKESFDGIETDGYGVVGSGFGFDLGVVYDFNKVAEGIADPVFSDIMSRVKVSMALTDIGYISWSGKNSMQLTSPNSETSFSPNDYIIGDDDGAKSLEDHLDDVMDDFGEALNFKETKQGKGRRTSLRTNMNIGLEYEAWKDNLSVGLLSSTHFGEYQTITEFTASANYNPNKSWFATSLSYSFVHSSFDTFGLAIHLAPSRGINLFLASDYVIPHVNSDFWPTTSKGVNVQLGLSIPIGSRRN